MKICNRTESAALIVDNNGLDEEIGKTETKETNPQPSLNEGTSNRWQKCAALKESESDITTQEEFYKFDFQVNQNHIPFQFNLIFFTMLKCFLESLIASVILI